MKKVVSTYEWVFESSETLLGSVNSCPAPSSGLP